MELVEPSVQYEASFMEAVKEFAAYGEDSDRAERYHEYVGEIEQLGFAEFVEREKSHARGEYLPEGHVPTTQWWLIDKGEYIGRVSIRHRLTEHLLR